MLKWLRGLFGRVERISDTLHLLTCNIHGSHYYDCLELVQDEAIHKGERLTLTREPDNEYDEYAIAVSNAQGAKLGYVPKNHNRVIAELMDQQCDIYAVVFSVLSTEWDPVRMTILMQR